MVEETSTSPKIIFQDSTGAEVSFYKTRSDVNEVVDMGHPYDAPVTENRELHSVTSDRSAKHIEFDTSGHPKFTYTTGDYLGVYSMNEPQLVQNIANHIGLPLNKQFAIDNKAQSTYH